MRIPLKRKQTTYTSNGNIALENLRNFQYQTDMSLGSPVQYANFVLDTAIGQTWINTINGHYEVSASKTANISTAVAKLDYGMGEIIGYKGTELFSLSNLTNLTMEMIFANYVNNTGVEADGVMGLSNDNSFQNIFQIASIAGQLSDAQFGFFLKDPSANSTAQFYISSNSFPITQLTWISASMLQYWAIAIVGTEIDNTTYLAGTADSQAIIDSGTDMLLIGKDSYNGLLQSKAISSLCQKKGLFYICECPILTHQNYPNIVFQTTNGNLTVVPNNYMIELSGGYCVMAVDYQNLLPTMLLGDSLLNNYFVAYDKSSNSIGFSSPLATTQTKESKNKFLFLKMKK